MRWHHKYRWCCVRRFTLLESSSGGGNEKPQETNRTAELNNQGLLQMQRSVMSEQDQELADLEATVGSTKVSIDTLLRSIYADLCSLSCYYSSLSPCSWVQMTCFSALNTCDNSSAITLYSSFEGVIGNKISILDVNVWWEAVTLTFPTCVAAHSTDNQWRAWTARTLAWWAGWRCGCFSQSIKGSPEEAKQGYEAVWQLQKHAGDNRLDVNPHDCHHRLLQNWAAFLRLLIQLERVSFLAHFRQEWQGCWRPSCIRAVHKARGCDMK